MTNLSNTRKNKIVLNDYPYERDIEHRILLASLNHFDLEVLTEIVDGSLKTSISHLAQYLSVGQDELLRVLQKLQECKLFRLEGGQILVSKELRKYFELQLYKFTEDFHSDLDFLQALLSKVPIHCLPNWYAISKTSDNIFESIIEKYFITPKTYERYLQELHFDYPPLDGILHDLLATEEESLLADDLKKKYDLSNEQFTECILHLEFSFVGFLSYKKIESGWSEVITPLYEWKEYLKSRRSLLPKPIEEEVRRFHPSNFGFIEDASTICQEVAKQPLQQEELKKKLPSLSTIPGPGSYLERLIKNLHVKNFVTANDHSFSASQIGKDWLPMTPQERAVMWYRTNLQFLLHGGSDEFCDRDMRHVEKSLRDYCGKGWYYIDDFTKQCTAPIGEHKEVALKKCGRQWRYVMPDYTEKDRQFLQSVLRCHFFECGMIAIGEHNGKACFSVTPFGCASFGE